MRLAAEKKKRTDSQLRETLMMRVHILAVLCTTLGLEGGS